MVSRAPSNWSTNKSDYLFYTLWVMIERDLNRIIGLFTFNGKPNFNGEVEVFFSIEKTFRKKGYATEVMTKILGWGAQSKLFKYILIEADFRNKAAMASLKKLGFQRVLPDIDEEEDRSTKFYKRVENFQEEEVLDFDT
jgi:RimJ/RimL family protein N-acetyltransferase